MTAQAYDRAEVTLWTNAARAGLVDAVVRSIREYIQPLAIGGPPPASLDELAKSLACPRENDLRKMLVEHPASFVLLATTEGVERQDIALALEQGSTVLTLEPVCSDLADLDAVLGQRGRRAGEPTRGRIVPLGSFSASPGFRSAADPRDVLGSLRLISLGSFGPAQGSSLYARLYDAWSIVLSFIDLPQGITATLTGVLAEPPATLQGLTGHLAVHAHHAAQVSCVMSLSDRAGFSGRSLHLVADGGHLAVEDERYQLHDAAGNLLDMLQPPATPSSFAELLARDWKQTLAAGAAQAASTPAEDHVLACCLATLLSTRTRQAESPGKLLRLTV